MNQRLALVAAVAIVIILFGGVTLLSFNITVYEATDYGDIALYNERLAGQEGAEIDATTTLNVQDGDRIVAWLRWNPNKSHKPTDENFTTSLRLEDGTWIEDGRDRKTTASNPPLLESSYKWWFDLDQCLQGTFTYYINYFVRIDTMNIVTGDSFTFQITNAEESVYDDVVIIDSSGTNVTFDVDETLAHVSWLFSYDGPCTASLTLDGEEIDSQDYGRSGANRIYTHNVDTSVAVSYKLVLTVTPDTSANPPLVSDTVQVTVGEPSTTTDTTTPTTTTEPPPPDYLWVYALIAIVVIAVVVKVAR